MWNGNLVIDAVAHADDFVDPNRVEDYAVHFEREIRTRLEAVPDVGAIEVEFRSEFDWTPDDMAPHIHQQLRECRERLIAELPVAPHSVSGVMAKAPARSR